MAYRGWSDKDLDLWIETYDDSSAHCLTLNHLLDKYPWKFCEKDNCGYIYIGDIPVDIWFGDEREDKCDLDRPFIMLWSR